MNDTKVKKNERSSSIELLRIFAIFIIIINHYAVHSGFDLSNKIATSTILIHWLHMGGKLGVCIFVFISGYFLSTRKKFKIDKLVSILLEVFFYSVILIIVDTIFLKRLNTMQHLKLLFAIPAGS